MADAANRAKTEFLSRMSHELRTPLNAVLGFAQLMEIDRTEPPAPGQRRRLKLIREAGEHLLQMIGDMLDLTRIEVGGMALQLASRCRCARWPRRRWRWCARRPTQAQLSLSLQRRRRRPGRAAPTARGCARCCSTCCPTPSSTTAPAAASSCG